MGRDNMKKVYKNIQFVNEKKMLLDCIYLMKLLPFLELHVRVFGVSFGVIEGVEVKLLVYFPYIIVKIVLFNKQELVKCLNKWLTLLLS